MRVKSPKSSSKSPPLLDEASSKTEGDGSTGPTSPPMGSVAVPKVPSPLRHSWVERPKSQEAKGGRLVLEMDVKKEESVVGITITKSPTKPAPLVDDLEDVSMTMLDADGDVIMDDVSISGTGVFSSASTVKAPNALTFVPLPTPLRTTTTFDIPRAETTTTTTTTTTITSRYLPQPDTFPPDFLAHMGKRMPEGGILGRKPEDLKREADARREAEEVLDKLMRGTTKTKTGSMVDDALRDPILVGNPSSLSPSPSPIPSSSWNVAESARRKRKEIWQDLDHPFGEWMDDTCVTKLRRSSRDRMSPSPKRKKTLLETTGDRSLSQSKPENVSQSKGKGKEKKRRKTYLAWHLDRKL